MKNKVVVLIPAAGSGLRFANGLLPKQYTQIGNKTILMHTLEVFVKLEEISQIVIVANAADSQIDSYSQLSAKIQIQKVGGNTRGISVFNGLNTLNCAADDWVLVHDAARCCIQRSQVLQLLNQLKHDAVGGILAIPATDTLKEVVDGVILRTLDRNAIYLAQTPQMFRYKVLKTALNQTNLVTLTDEASAVEQLGLEVKLVMGNRTNIKVTYPDDLEWAELILKRMEQRIIADTHALY